MKENLIYIRTSTEEQNPELQIKDCKILAEKLNITNYEILSDKVSGWKELERENFNKVLKEIKFRNVNTIIVWDVDRLYRNRTKLVSFFELCKLYNCKIYSYRQQFLEEINKSPAPWNDIIFTMLLQILGWMAEDESKKKSDRVKLAVVSVDKEGNKIKTKSKYGNKWGRKELKNKKMVNEILELNEQKLSMVEIANRVFYYDKSNNKKHPSPSSVWKIIKLKRISVI